MQLDLNNEESGATAVEFGLILPVMVALIMAIAEFGFIFFSQQSSQLVARDLARMVSTNQITSSNLELTGRPRLPSWVRSGASFTLTQTNPADPTSNYITVQIDVPFRTAAVTGFFQAIYPATPLRAVATMRQEEAVH
jgi:Flp pilus assembly protein TadG